MERRGFFKAGLGAMLALYGFTREPWRRASEGAPEGQSAGTGDDPRSEGYAGTLTGEGMLLPAALVPLLRRKRFVLFASEKSASLLLVPESSPEGTTLKQMGDAAATAGTPVLLERAAVDREGHLLLPARVRRFAGIHTPAVAVSRYGRAIEIRDANAWRSAPSR